MTVSVTLSRRLLRRAAAGMPPGARFGDRWHELMPTAGVVIALRRLSVLNGSQNASDRDVVAIRVGAEQVEGLPDELSFLRVGNGIALRALEAVITERVPMGDPVATIRVLDAVANSGVAFAIEDSERAPSHLRSRAPRRYRSLRSFVMWLPHVDPDANMVRGSIELERGVNKRVVAASVQTLGALRTLLPAGYVTGDGSCWSRPLSAATFRPWATADNTTSTTPVPSSSAGARAGGDGLVALHGFGRWSR